MTKTIGMAMMLLVAAGWAVVADAAAPAGQPAKELKLDLGNNVTMKLVLIPAGKFLMGSPKDEENRGIDEGRPDKGWTKGDLRVEMTISKAFYLGAFDVTVDQYAQSLKGSAQPARGPQYEIPNFKQAGDHPVVSVSWNDAQTFCQWMSKKTGKTVVLPTEAQWEYACRAGTQTRFNFGEKDENLVDYAWCNANSKNMTHPVGQKKPNSWGLYDMHGNVWQWCSDDSADEYAGVGPKMGEGIRVRRGGSWRSFPHMCRSASRLWASPDDAEADLGFRVAVAVD